jgi:hypothetical protein
VSFVVRYGERRTRDVTPGNAPNTRRAVHISEADKSNPKVGVGMTPVETARRRKSTAKRISHKVIAAEVKVVDSYVPARLLLFYLNLLDKRVPPKVRAAVADGVGKYVPEKIRAAALTAADEYVPDDVANSWKICAVIAGIAKYVPEKIVPKQSTETWEYLRVKYHIPTVIEKPKPRP